MSRDLPPPRAASSLESLRKVLDEASGSFVPLEKIQIVSGFNPRAAIQSEDPFTPDALKDLVESVREHGILQPLLVRPLERGKYALVAGERRLHASRLAGLEEVPVLIREMSDADADEFALQENLQRSDLSSDAKALLAIRAVAKHMQVSEDQVVLVANRVKKSGQDPERLGDMLRRSFGISVSTFAQRYGKFTQLNEAERQVIMDGRFGVSTLIPLTTMSDKEQRSKILEKLLRGDIKGDDIQREVAAAKRGQQAVLPLDHRVRQALPRIRALKGEQREEAERLLEQLLSLTARQAGSQSGNS